MISQEIIGELKAATDKLFQNYRQLLEGIDVVQDSSKVKRKNVDFMFYNSRSKN